MQTETGGVTLSPLAQICLQQLLREWFEFERRLAGVPIVKRLNAGQFSVDDYRKLLLHLRQQVVEGARWITRGASSFDRDFLDVRSLVIGHAYEEHQDYAILEKDYQSAGGDLSTLHSARRNPGSEALHGYLMYRAGKPNPTDLIGAMWIIEGLGQKMASEWAKRIQEALGSSKVTTTFMSYHGENDERHLDKLYLMLDRVCTDARVSQSIVMTARVVARLYAMQLEEIDNDTKP